MSQGLPKSSRPQPKTGLHKPWWAIIAVAALTAIGAGLVSAVPPLATWVRSFFPIQASLLLSVKDAEEHPMTGVQFWVLDLSENKRLRLTNADGKVATSKNGVAYLNVRAMPGSSYAIEARYKDLTTTIPIPITGDLQREIIFDRKQWTSEQGRSELYVSVQSTSQKRPEDLQPWIKIAYDELGVKEYGTKPGNSRILEYLKSACPTSAFMRRIEGFC